MKKTILFSHHTSSLKVPHTGKTRFYFIFLFSLFFSIDHFNFKSNVCNAQFQTLLQFNDTNGNQTYASLVLSNGKLFGVTVYGGKHGKDPYKYGVIFSIDTNGKNYKDIHDFDSINGKYPDATLTLIGGKLFGVAGAGGAKNAGTIFSLDTNGNNFKTLFVFDSTDGAQPWSRFVISGHVLYGTVYSGGAFNDGGIFSIDTNGSGFTFLHSFNGIEGQGTEAGLTFSGKKFYGVTRAGGTSGLGVVFSMDTNGNNYKVLLNFSGANGNNPTHELTLSGKSLYETTYFGGAYGYGLVFSIDTDGSGYKDLLDFNGGGNGGYPWGPLDVSGNVIVGMAQWGAANYYGDIFTMNIDGSAYKDWFDFNYTANNGAYPLDNLVFGGSTAYGTTNLGGKYGDGVVFKYKFPCIITTVNITNVSCKGGNNGSATVSIFNHSSPPYTYTWSPSGGTDSTASGLKAGTYTVTVTNHDGCSVTNSVTITQPAFPLIVSVNVIDEIHCYGEGNVGKASAIVKESTPPLTYSWAPSGGSSDTASNLSLGTYTVTVTDACGNSKTASVSITQPASALSISIKSETSPTCNGGLGSATADSATGGTRFIKNKPVINTFAGNGIAGYNGDEIAAITAEINLPTQLAIDDSGNIFIAEQNNHRIRKINSSGIISTVAGTGIAGYNGDGGPATSAQLNTPQGVAVDGSGNIYIGDYNNNRVRKVSTSGIITTIAGNGNYGYNGDGIAATAAQLANPTAIGIDASGNVLIADIFNYRVRKVNSSGIISTIAGNGWGGYSGDGGQATSAELSIIYAVRMDASGNIYLTDFNNNRIRKINTSGIISTVAGNGNAGFSGDGGNATSAELNNPNGVWVDGSNNLYIADYNNERIREVNTAGRISTIVGDGVKGYSGDGGPATAAEINWPADIVIDASGNVFIAELGGNRIRTYYNGGSSYTYRWTPSGGTNLTASNLSAGTYTITATDAHGCTASASVTITQPAGLSVTATITSNVSCNGLNNGSASSTITGGTAPYTYLWTGGGTNATVSGLSAGTYTLNVTDATAACAIAVVNITQPSVLSASAVSTNINCNGVNDGTATSTVNGGTLPYTYLWTGGGTTVALSGLSAGTYSLNVTDIDGCSATASVTITQPASPVTINIVSHTDPNCNGGFGSATADSATGGVPYPMDSLYINTMAGNGIYGDYGDGGPATAAELGNPIRVVLDKNGNKFIADFGGNEVREVNKSTGVITTIAGNGIYGFSGDGGPATAAELGNPEGVAVDDSGNIYIADLSNARIRKVNTAGIISTIAGNGNQGFFGDGGPATAAEFYYVRDLAVDGSGNVYIVDCNNNRIREINTSGIINTIVGTGAGGYNGDNIFAIAADLNFPIGISVDGSGNIFIADYSNERVRQVDLSGVIHTIAGNGVVGYSGDGGNATSAELNGPFGVSSDVSGNIFIADYYNNVVRKVNSSGIISTLAGTHVAGYNGDGIPATSAQLNNPTGVATDGSGNVFIADELNNRIRDVKAFNNSYTYNWTPSGGTNLVASNLSAGTYTITATDTHGCNGTASIAITQPGGLSVTANVTANITCNGLNNGSASSTVSGGTPPYTYLWTGGGTTANISGLSAGTYTLQVSDNTTCAVATITITQPLLLTASVSGTNINCSGLNDGSASCTVNGGTLPYTYLWTGGNTNSSISGLTPGIYNFNVTDGNGCSVSASINITQPASPLAIGIASVNNVPCFGGIGSATASVPTGGSPNRIITTIAGNGVSGYTGDGGAATSAEMNTPEGVAVDGSGNVYFVDLNNSRVRKIDPSGIITTIAGNGVGGFWGDGGPATAAELNTPLSVAIDGSGNIYIADQLNERVRKINTSGTISTVAGNGIAGFSGDGGPATAAEFNGLTGLSVDGSGNIFISDFTNNRIRKINTSGIIITVAGNGTGGYSGDGGAATAAEINNPDGVFVDGLGNIFITDQTNNRIRKVNTLGIISTVAGNGTAGYNGDGIPATSAEIYAPKRVTADGLGNVYFSDENNNRIRQIDISGIISTVAGNGIPNYSGDGGPAGSAEIFNPIGVAVDGSGNVYIGDKLNNRIREVIPEYTYLWTPSGGTNITASNLTPGSYTVTTTDLNGCTGTASVTITQPNILTANASLVSEVTCFGAHNGAASTTVNGGTTPYTYSWSPSGGTNSTATGLISGTYTVTVTDSNGCNTTAKVTITAPNPLSITLASQTNVQCFGDTGNATANPATGGTSPYTYLWSPFGGTNLTITGVTAGTYTITATDNHGCSATASADITQPASQLSITINSLKNVSCNGGTGWIIANPPTGGTSPYIYYWTPSGGTTLTASGLSAGTYTIITIDAHLCFNTAIATITQPNPLVATTVVTANVNCIVGNDGSGVVNASGGTVPYTYSWSDGETTSALSALTAGVYTVMVTDSNSCSATASLTITQPPQLRDSIISSSNITCNNANNGTAVVGVKGGTLPYTYSWSPSGKTTAAISGLSALTYTVSVTDFCGYSTTASVTITQPAPLLISIASHTNVLCNGGYTGTATADSANGGTKPYAYVWSPSGGSNLTASGLKDTTYTITVNDANGCTAFASVNITQPAVLSASSAVNQNVSCNGGSNGSGSLSTSGGTIPYTYLWSNSQTSANLTGVSAGTYSVSVSDANGCTTTNSVTITQPALLGVSAIVKTNIFCNDSSTGVLNSIASGGVQSYTYLWSNGKTSIADTGLVAGTYTITVTDNNGCSATASATIIQTSALTVIRDSARDNGTCTGFAAIRVSGGTSPYTYLWAPGNETTDSIYGQCAGIYCCEITDVNHCKQNICITIKETDGINTINNTSTIDIYPDPNNGYFSISGLHAGQMIELYNTLGQKLFSEVADKSTRHFTISSLPNGVYLIRIRSKDGSIIVQKKIVKTQ